MANGAAWRALQVAISARGPQPSIAKIEKRTDMYLSTLRSHIEAMGGEVDVQRTLYQCASDAQKPLLKVGYNFGGRTGTCKQVTLCLIAAQSRYVLKLHFGLDSFCHRIHSQPGGKRHDRLYDCRRSTC